MTSALVTSYEGRVCRAPIERGTYTVPVSVGCPYNRCKFCGLFKHLKYREIPLDQIEAELGRAASLGADPRAVFLGDGNAFDLPVPRLAEVLRMVRRAFPSCEEIKMDATVTSILRRSDSELRSLASLGARRLYIGIESGLDDVLKMMDKDHDMAQARTAAARLIDAGMIYDAHIMTGIAGRGRGMENAEATASFLIDHGASRVTNFSMFVGRRRALYREMRAGKIDFHPASEQENLEEARRLVDLLSDAGRDIFFDSSHDFIGLRTTGHLPTDRDRMARRLDDWIARTASQPPAYAIHEEYPDTEEAASGD